MINCRPTCWLLLSLLFSAPTPATAQRDRIRLWTGSEIGEITAMTPLEVTLDRGSIDKKISVAEIRGITFDKEPTELSQARLNAENGGYENALTALDKIDAAQVTSDFIKQDIAFYKAFCAAKLALLGAKPIAETGRDLNAFIAQNPKNYHFLQANELVGDLLLAAGSHAKAQEKYELLAKTPFPSYKMRAGVLLGRALQAQNKHAEALQQFNTVLTIVDTAPQAKDQLLAAKLGKAESLSATGKVDEGVKIVEQVITEASPEDAPLNARAYNALGSCYLKADRQRDALYAYLHTDILYGNVPEAHAEALANLVKLWNDIGQPTQSRQAEQVLQERYASTRWAKQ